MIGTMNNGRQMYMAQFEMSNDGATVNDATSGWPGDLPAPIPTTITGYLNVLCGKGYLKGADAVKLMNVPSANYVASVASARGIDTLTYISGTPGLKVWAVQDVDPGDDDLLYHNRITFMTPHSCSTDVCMG